MKSLYEELDGTYTLGDDGMLYPDLAISETEQGIPACPDMPCQREFTFSVSFCACRYKHDFYLSCFLLV